MAEKLKSKLPEGVEEFLAVYAPYMDSVAGSKPSDRYKPDQDMLERQHEMAMEFLNSMRRSGGVPSVRYSGGGGGGSPSMGGGGYVPPPMDSVTKPAVTPATTPEVAAEITPSTDAYTFKREEPAKKGEKKKDDEGEISPLIGLIPGALAGAWLWGKGAGKAASKFAIPWGDAPKGVAPKALEGKAPKGLLEGDGFIKHYEQQGTGKPMTPEDFLKYYMGKAASDKTPLKDVKDIGNLPSLSPQGGKTKWTKAKGGSGVKIDMRDEAGENHYSGRGSLKVFGDNVLTHEWNRLMDEAKAKGEVSDMGKIEKHFRDYFGDDLDIYNKYKRSAFKDATDEELNTKLSGGPVDALARGAKDVDLGFEEFGNAPSFKPDANAKINAEDQMVINKLTRDLNLDSMMKKQDIHLLEVRALENAVKNESNVGYEMLRLLEEQYGFNIPKELQEEVSKMTKERWSKTGSPRSNLLDSLGKAPKKLESEDLKKPAKKPAEIPEMGETSGKPPESLPPELKNAKPSTDGPSTTSTPSVWENLLKRNEEIKKGLDERESGRNVEKFKKKITSENSPYSLKPKLDSQTMEDMDLEGILRQLEDLKGQFGDILPMKDQKMVSFGNEKAFQLSPELKKLLAKEKNISTIKRMLEDMRNKGKK